MRHSSIPRNLFVGLTVTVAAVAMAGCASPKVMGPTNSEESTAVPTSLPDGVPLAKGATLAAAPRMLSGTGVNGWSAVALMPVEDTPTATAAQVSSQLRGLGWTVTSGPVPGGDSIMVTAKKAQGVTAQWLHITVTAPVPQGGPAVTYRYAAGAEPAVTPS